MRQNILSLPERIQLLYERLQSAPPCRTADEALELIHVVLEAVEDEWSGVPRDPNPGLKFEGRMYPPQGDFIKLKPNGEKVALTKGHQITIGANGDITFVHSDDGVVEFFKQGAR